MRKFIILPGVAVAAGVVGLVLRRWELATAFEPDTGLVTSGMPATWLLLLLSIAFAVVLALLCRGEHNPFPGGYDEAFSAKGNRPYLYAMAVSALLMLGAALMLLWLFFTRQNTAITRLLLAVLCVISAACVLMTAKNNFRDEQKGKYSFTLLMPAYTCCLWLIAAYQARAADPVILDYLYELFAIIASLLGLYFTAGFSFERAKVFRASFFSLLGIYFSIVTLADHHDRGFTLLYGFVIVYLVASTSVLLYNAVLPGARRTGREANPEGTEESTNEAE